MAAGFSGSPGSGMRVGHAEREAVTAELREHYASGRLTLDELNERLDAALDAKTRADLDALMTDLPSAGPGAGTGNGPSGRHPGTGQYPGGGRDANTGGDAFRGWNPGRGAGQAIAALAWSALVIVALLSVGMLAVFGIGVGRPFGIVLLLAGLAFLRRLFFRRGSIRTRRPRRRW
ncbi:MAG: DUF1707 domain-containing protein [Nocardiopsaceae bacterium]|nr:DUF1707 domain-containing protein [Nocardiopsaceae bacterium]